MSIRSVDSQTELRERSSSFRKATYCCRQSGVNSIKAKKGEIEVQLIWIILRSIVISFIATGVYMYLFEDDSITKKVLTTENDEIYCTDFDYTCEQTGVAMVMCVYFQSLFFYYSLF